MPDRAREKPAPRQGRRSAPLPWKLIVFGESPWRGEIYQSRAGHRRLLFSSPEEFAASVLALTQWPVPVPHAAAPVPVESGTGHLASGTEPPIREGGSKFVLAADAPWRGQAYRTRSGHVRLKFLGVEEFISAVIGMTGWSLHGAPSGQLWASPAAPGKRDMAPPAVAKPGVALMMPKPSRASIVEMREPE